MKVKEDGFVTRHKIDLFDDGEIRTHALIEQWISNPSP